MKRHFYTYFDTYYLPRALVLYRSLRATGVDFTLHAVCLDDVAWTTLKGINAPGFEPVPLGELESADADLMAARETRSLVEYYFTLTAPAALFLLDRQPEIDIISYLDADLCFYSSPDRVIETLGDESVLIIPHGFPERLRHHEQYGLYNVGMVTFRNDHHGRTALQRWRHQCIEWCYDRVEDGKFADQRYLDDWPDTLDSVVVADVPGIGLAPWNASRFVYDLTSDPPTVDRNPLVFYHFQGLRSIGRHLYYDGLREYGPIPADLRRAIYRRYVADLRRATRDVAHVASTADSLRWRVPFTWRSFLDLARHRHVLYDIGPRVLG